MFSLISKAAMKRKPIIYSGVHVISCMRHWTKLYLLEQCRSRRRRCSVCEDLVPIVRLVFFPCYCGSAAQHGSEGRLPDEGEETRDHWQQQNGCLLIWHEGTTTAWLRLICAFFPFFRSSWYEKYAFIQRRTHCFPNTKCTRMFWQADQHWWRNRKQFKENSSFSISN